MVRSRVYRMTLVPPRALVTLGTLTGVSVLAGSRAIASDFASIFDIAHLISAAKVTAVG